MNIERVFEFLIPGISNAQLPPLWAPDAFALVATVLRDSGGYARVLENWPPSLERTWQVDSREAGDAWRAAMNMQDSAQIPANIRLLWTEILQQKALRIDELARGGDSAQKTLRNLLMLMVFADEACRGFGAGYPGLASEQHDRAFREAYAMSRNHENQSSLCKQVSPGCCVVLPKMHTPQSGLTIRSFSHYLALCPSSQIRPKWHISPSPARATLNFLLLPWPLDVNPHQFRQANHSATTNPGSANPPNFFDYKPDDSSELLGTVQRTFTTAQRRLGNIDAVIMPELALDAQSFRTVESFVHGKQAGLISGCSDSIQLSGHQHRGKNQVWISPSPNMDMIKQSKHHRWKLEKSQIRQYALAGQLDPNFSWWENIDLTDRTLNFVQLAPDFVLSALVCEDLARPDPAGDLLRAVGPNLIIALLMDGPQIKDRWSSRYATVLADDPGSSVLSLTCRGMTSLSRNFAGESKRGVIGLWKDSINGSAIELELQGNQSGLVISVSLTYVDEISADGRSDNKAAAVPTLTGILAI